jgi:tetratricopeptide (TPR) repeat protein
MKTIKYVFVGALMLSLSAPVVAQDNKAAIDEATQLVKSKADVKEVKSFAKKYKKNGEVLTGLARAYYEQQDTANARIYAVQATGLKYAPAYVLLGDIAALADDGGAAGLNYQQAMHFDPKYPDAYVKYATMYSKVDPNGAISTLEELRVQVPDYPVDLPMAKLYMKANKLDDAITAYDKWYTTTDYSKKEPGDVAGYALIHYMKKNYDKSMVVVNEASTKYPRSSSINRIGLMNTVAQQKFEDALTWGDRLFNKSDSANFNDFDYTNYAQAHIGVGKYDDAIALYRKGMEVSNADQDAVNNLRKEISDAYMQKGEFDQAVAEYRLYLDGTSKKTASDYSALAEMYYKHAADQEGEDQKNSIREADKIYAEIEGMFANNVDVLAYVLNRRGTLNVILDPDSKDGLAKPIFEKLMQLMESKEDRTKADNTKLVTSYRYLMSYTLLVQDDKQGARDWAEKILTVDPENEQAKQVLENIK